MALREEAAGPPKAEGRVLLAAARLLHENGEETQATLRVFARLRARLGVEASLLPTWAGLFLQSGGLLSFTAAAPTEINMGRVIAAHRAAEAAQADHLPAAEAALADAGRVPEFGLLPFTCACGFGAGALSVINGASHLVVLSLIMLCAAAGAVLRRSLGQRGVSPFGQVFAASLLAGLVGAVGVRLHLSSAMRLIALGPLLVLVPGPAILSGVFDLAGLRLPLGFARLGFGLLTILAISAGVLLGLSFGGTFLPADPPARPVPLWEDVLCAGVAAGAYGIFFAMPSRMLALPMLAGMTAHAVRWAAISGLGLSVASGAGLACLLVGMVLAPAARRLRLPFAGVGFASVVSMVPGVFLFRMGGGLLQIQKDAGAAPATLVGAVVSDGATALLVVVAMGLGLLLPMTGHALWEKRRRRNK